ncbi:MAG: transcriptional repressor [Clostridiales bacterium]|nr:transcriptional repressor [Clostridiales bacterium]
MDKAHEIILKKLKLNGYKLTPQRKAVIDVILKNEHKHLNTEEIYDALKKKYPKMGLATVYRTLLILDKISVVSKVNFDDGYIRYEINTDSSHHHHHHLICIKCGKVIEVIEDLLDDLERTVEQKYEFKIDNHNVKIYGLCKECLDDQ